MLKPIGEPNEEDFFPAPGVVVPKKGDTTPLMQFGPLKTFKDNRVHVAIAIPAHSAITFYLNALKDLGGEFVTHDMAVMPPSPLEPMAQPQILKVLVYLFEPEKIRAITGDGYNSKTMYDISRFVKQ